MNRYVWRKLANRLLGRYFIRVMAGARPMVSERINGRQLTYDVRSDIGTSLFFTGHFEAEEMRVCRQWLQENSVILDIGANIGLHTVSFANVARRGTVFAFEPAKGTYALLLRNISGMGNIVPVHAAAARRSGISNFYIAADNAYSGLKDTRRKPVVGMEKVMTLAMDDFFRSLGLESIDLVKIDVEGWETEVLEGMHWILSSYSPIVFCEIYHGTNSNTCPQETIAFLCGLGYRTYVLKGGDLVEYNGKHDDRFYNYFFLPARPNR